MIGIDEVGRGCWAGPLLVVAARQKTDLPAGLDDSKRLSRDKREQLAPLIYKSCDLGEGWVSAAEIDKLGITESMYLGVLRALLKIEAKTDELILMDGNINYCAPKFREAKAVIGGDALHPIISAASIWAKVRRDRYMVALPEDYAKYEFHKHVGYGTAQHKHLLEKHGVSDQHRKSYRPIADLLARTAVKRPSPTDTGAKGEQMAAETLAREGYEILMRNWKTRNSEIDIIALKNGRLCFIEVKYRRSSAQGDGLDYITPTKLRHMTRAAESWVLAHGHYGEYQLLAAAVDGAGMVDVREIA
jgi:ribonuclease HII